MNKNDWTKIDKLSKKLRAINLLGGECEICGNNNIFSLEFHHKDKNDKEEIINRLLSYRWSIIEKEVKKCMLLCGNCHIKLHHHEDDTLNKWKNNKKIFLEFKGINGCEKCGYNDCNESLNFHHVKGNKEFMIGKINIQFNNIHELSEKIENELNKCIILCKNCHTLEHSDIEFYEKNKKSIMDKTLNFKEIQSKIDRNKIYEMYEMGMSQKNIAEYFNASISTIGLIIRNK
jgi:Trp operon repressor